MRNIWKFVTSSLIVLIILGGCGNVQERGENESDDPIKVVTTFTLLEDIVKQIGGERVEVHNLVPIGTDPHEYEPLPKDIKAATDADVLFYNGLNLEGGETGWFAKLVDSVGKKEEYIFMVTKDIEPMYLSSEDGSETEVNPHSFLDPVNGIQMTENTRDALIDIDPDHKELYEENAKAYLDILREVDEEYKQKIAEIPKEKRILVTSERAYQYMADRYGLKEGYIWEVDTEETGTPKQIKSLLRFIKENDVSVLFLETNVDPRPMETVSKESGVEIYAKVFSDEIGSPGEEGDTYVKLLKYNIEKIHEGLTKK